MVHRADARVTVLQWDDPDDGGCGPPSETFGKNLMEDLREDCRRSNPRLATGSRVALPPPPLPDHAIGISFIDGSIDSRYIVRIFITRGETSVK